MTTVPTTKRQAYLDAKERVRALEEELRKLSNRLFEEMGKAEDAATDPLREALEAARLAAIDRYHTDHGAEYLRLEELRRLSSEARRVFAAFEYDCDHKDERGESAVRPEWPFGCDPGDKPSMKCSVCGETWK